MELFVLVDDSSIQTTDNCLFPLYATTIRPGAKVSGVLSMDKCSSAPWLMMQVRIKLQG